MQIITTGVDYSQLLDDLRAIIRHEVSHKTPINATLAPDTEPELLTVRSAATYLDICVQTVHDWKRRGILTYYKIGGRTYLKRTDLMHALQTHKRAIKPARKGPADQKPTK